ncbi:hypothetical protein EYZ11_012341 [Aspergillus tanneri]|uniref:Major facilitator superfamily (MFS) profile domain-containing protein n=1 Tax=Aspergillus tanneri TaxID=1220188 RepID=A0A4S3J0H8_9EURO|nr:hypothetical protein EYZ11_012341 [Aspergillus tanneri]
MLVAFTFWQRHLENGSRRQPLLKVSMFKNIRFSAIFVLVGCFFASFNSFVVFATYFYQDYLYLSELETTLRFLPAGISGVSAFLTSVVLISFVVSPALSRIRGFYILLVGLVCGIGSPFLLALPAIPPETSYWAYGFPAMCLCFSAEIIWPVSSLFIAEELPQENQALGGGLLQTANNVGRALGLTIGTAVRTSIQGNNNGGYPGDADLLRGLRAAQWVNVGLAVTSTAIALVFFHNLGRH